MKKLILLLLIPLILLIYDVKYISAKPPVLEKEMEMGFFVGKEQFHFKVLKSESGRHVWITPVSSPNRPVWKFRGYATPLNVRIEVSYVSEGSFKIIEHEPTGQKIYLVRFDGKTAHCELAPETTSSQLSSNKVKSEETKIQSSTSSAVKREETPRSELAVDSSPQGATVYIDEQFRGTTPLVIGIKPGTHSVEVGKCLYEDHREQIEVRAGETKTVFPLLKKETQPQNTISQGGNQTTGSWGELVVDSSPQGADVWLDGTLVGTTPLRLSDVKPGYRTLRVTYPGYDNYYDTFQHGKGTKKEIFATLAKRDTYPPSLPPPPVNSEKTGTQRSKGSDFLSALGNLGMGMARAAADESNRADAERRGFNYDCIKAVNEMVKSGEVSKAKGDLLVNSVCKQPQKDQQQQSQHQQEEANRKLDEIRDELRRMKIERQLK